MFMANMFTGDANKPSFFEMVAVKQLTPLFQPATRYVATVFASRYPNSLAWTVKYHDELFFAGLAFLEHHFLKYYDSSFAENFYALKRVVVTLGGTKKTTLRPWDKRYALVTLVLLPYLKHKLDSLYKRISRERGNGDEDVGGFFRAIEQEDGETANESDWKVLLRSFALHWFVKGYPFFHAFYEFAVFLYQVMYLYDRTQYFSPALHSLGQVVDRLSMEDMVLQNQGIISERTQAMKSLLGDGVLVRMARFAMNVYFFLLDYARITLPGAIFLFQFFEWMYREQESAPTAVSTPIPPPPRAPGPPTKEDAENEQREAAGDLSPIPLPEDRSVCALCLEGRTNSALLATGYVFCYPCIFRHVEEHQRCPVTLRKVSQDQIIRLYED